MNVMREEDIVSGGSMSVEEATDRAARLLDKYGHLQGVSLIEPMVHEEFQGRVTMTSSFGTEAAALLALVAEVDRDLPVIFLDTRKLFGETHKYREQLVDQLGLTNIRIMRPDEEKLKAEDPNGMLFASDTAKCCYLRKVEPLQRALEGYDAWLTGRKRFHGGERDALPVIEPAGTRIKISKISLSIVRCHAIRFRPKVSCRLAACPAQTALIPIQPMYVPVAGPVRTRPNAVFTTSSRHIVA